MGNVAELQDASFDVRVLKSTRPVLVDFWAVGCLPCEGMAPIVEELAAEFASKVDFYKVDIVQNRQFAAQYGVRGIPTLLLFKNGQVLDQVVGAAPKARLQAVLKKVI